MRKIEVETLQDRTDHYSRLATIHARRWIHRAIGNLALGIALRRIQRFEEVEHFGEIIRTEDREGAVTDEQVRADGGDTVNISRDGVDGHAVVEGDPRSD